MSIFLDIMKEELERNLLKQDAFREELKTLPKGYLSICHIDGKDYVYRKFRENGTIKCEYIGTPGDKSSKKAEIARSQYKEIKEAIKGLKLEEKKLRRAIKSYE